MIFKREIEKRLIAPHGKGRVTLLSGPSQSGKSFLLQRFSGQEKNFLLLNASITQDLALIRFGSNEEIKGRLRATRFLWVDEAQIMSDLQTLVSRILNLLPDLQIILSVNSLTEELNEWIGENIPQIRWLKIFPLSWSEFELDTGKIQANSDLENRILYGMFPEVIMHPGNESNILNKIISVSVLEDIFSRASIRKTEIPKKLLRILAINLGTEISCNEMARLVEVDKNTIIHYLEILENAFVVFRLNSLSRNGSYEVSDGRKYYFYDTGIRNAILKNFNPPELRLDWEALWENFLIAEKLKSNQNNGIWADCFFWRSYQQQKVEYLEETSAGMNAWKFKWNSVKGKKFPITFSNAYPGSVFEVINKDNFHNFLGID